MDRLNTETAQSFQRWHQGDFEGLKRLLARHLPWIRERVQKRLGHKLRRMMDSSDVVQDAAVQFLQYGPRIVISDEAHFRALLARIVENILRDKHDWFTAHRRNLAKQRPLPSETVLQLDPPKDAVKTPSQSVVRHEREAWLRLGMELLEPDDRELLILRQWDNLSFEVIGQKLEIEANTARMRYQRTLGRLARKVGDLRRGKMPNL